MQDIQKMDRVQLSKRRLLEELSEEESRQIEAESRQVEASPNDGTITRAIEAIEVPDNHF